jgi:hypothetical protein
MKRAKSQISSTKSQINLNDQNSKSQTLIVESLNSRPSGESRIGSGTGAGVQKLLDHWIALKLHYVPGFSDCVAIDKNLHIAVFVIPGLTRNPVLFQSMALLDAGSSPA